MNQQVDQPIAYCTAFQADRKIAQGELQVVVEVVKSALDRDEQLQIVIFNDADGEMVEVDFRGSLQDVLQRLRSRPENLSGEGCVQATQAAARGPGRPKLGVVAKEVTLLPRHWEWLGSQPGGASVTLRKLVEEARRVNRKRDAVRSAKEATYRFMAAMAGNRPGFEEANRALFAGNQQGFEMHIDGWPVDIKAYAAKLAEGAFDAAQPS